MLAGRISLVRFDPFLDHPHHFVDEHIIVYADLTACIHVNSRLNVRI